MEFPEPLEGTWDEPDNFGAALRLHATRHGETIYHLHKAVVRLEDGSYAIQDTPEMVAQHYGRFLPQDKAEIAARILNKVWEAA